MLLEFRVKNFCCLRDEQIFSMVASSSRALWNSNTTSTGIKAAPHILNSAVIYGANAGGKTTLIRAFRTMRNIVLYSSTKPTKLYSQAKRSVVPFMLDKEYASSPTSFEVKFIKDGIRYEYGFTCTSEKIFHEYLDVYKTAKPQRWFERELVGNTYIYKFSSHFKGQKRSWQEQTRDDALFLSTAVQFNSEMLSPIFFFFIDDIFIVSSVSLLKSIFPIIESLYKSKKLQGKLCDFLRGADISIDSIDIRKKEISVLDADDSEPVPQQYEILFKHKTSSGEATFPLADESLGTQNLFYLYMPLFSGLKNGETLIIDELDSSLHPLVVAQLIKVYHSKELNSLGAQLIFTTHDTSLLKGINKTLFRRDQVWFVEKNMEQASELYSLAEFNSTNDNDAEKSYFQGRYGGLPIISFDVEG